MNISDTFKRLNSDGLHAGVTAVYRQPFDQAIWGDRLWLYSSWVLFHDYFFIPRKVPKGHRERFQVTPCSRWPPSTPFSPHHWFRRAEQMAIAVLLAPAEAGPGPPLSTGEGKRGAGREAQGWCWISHPTASGLARPGAEGHRWRRRVDGWRCLLMPNKQGMSLHTANLLQMLSAVINCDR